MSEEKEETKTAEPVQLIVASLTIGLDRIEINKSIPGETWDHMSEHSRNAMLQLIWSELADHIGFERKSRPERIIEGIQEDQRQNKI